MISHPPSDLCSIAFAKVQAGMAQELQRQLHNRMVQAQQHADERANAQARAHTHAHTITISALSTEELSPYPTRLLAPIAAHDSEQHHHQPQPPQPARPQHLQPPHHYPLYDYGVHVPDGVRAISRMLPRHVALVEVVPNAAALSDPHHGGNFYDQQMQARRHQYYLGRMAQLAEAGDEMLKQHQRGRGRLQLHPSPLSELGGEAAAREAAAPTSSAYYPSTYPSAYLQAPTPLPPFPLQAPAEKQIPIPISLISSHEMTREGGAAAVAAISDAHQSDFAPPLSDFAPPLSDFVPPYASVDLPPIAFADPSKPYESYGTQQATALPSAIDGAPANTADRLYARVGLIAKETLVQGGAQMVAMAHSRTQIGIQSPIEKPLAISRPDVANMTAHVGELEGHDRLSSPPQHVFSPVQPHATPLPDALRPRGCALPRIAVPISGMPTDAPPSLTLDGWERCIDSPARERETRLITHRELFAPLDETEKV